jgi:hypothetical protein
MKRILAIVAILGLLSAAMQAQNSLYDQEGTAADGYSALDATGLGPNADPDNSWLNWKAQWGGGSWSGVYGDSGWIEESTSGDTAIDVECDIEMYYTEVFENNKVYFHLGNIYTATTSDKTAYVSGVITYNNGMYIGINFEGTSKDISNMEVDGSGDFTGRILNAMDGTVDVLGRDISGEHFDMEILLDWDGNGWTPPVAYGDGASGTIHDTLWWLVNNGAPGTYNVTWRLRLEPEEHQPDGNYNFDPCIVGAPIL